MILKYILFWVPLLVLAIINGAIRDFLYLKQLGKLAAHQFSTITLIILISIYYWIISSYLDIKTTNHAIIAGITWMLLTLIFEFSFGLIAKKSWSELFEAYNILKGELWILIPLWVLVVPYIIFKIKS